MPARERWKKYPAQSGYVFQYIYRGYRELTDPAGREFVFEVRKPTSSQVAVRISDAAIADAERAVDREFMQQEPYAIAKLSLFCAFDEDGPKLPAALSPSSDEMVEFLATLGRA